AGAAAAPPDSPVLGVVILTDGRHNWGESPLSLARSLGAKNIPVYPVNVAARESPPDVAVVAVVPAVSTACRGSSVPLETRVRITRTPPGAIRVELRFPDSRPPLVRTIPHDGSDRVHAITFHPTLDRPGTQVLTVLANPGRPDSRPENNTRTTSVRVVEDKPRVLLVDGEARWDFRALHAALQQSPKLPDGPDALAVFDCIVLGNVTAEQLSVKDRERLEKYVVDVGGRLVVVASERFVPVGLAETTSDSDPLRKLLPIRNPRVFAPTDGGFRPELTPAGRAAWFLKLTDTPDENTATWEKLPELQWAAI